MTWTGDFDWYSKADKQRAKRLRQREASQRWRRAHGIGPRKPKRSVVFQQDRLLVMYQGEPYRLIDTFISGLPSRSEALIKATGPGSRSKRPFWVPLDQVEGHEAGSSEAASIMAQRREVRATKRPRVKRQGPRVWTEESRALRRAREKRYRDKLREKQGGRPRGRPRKNTPTPNTPP